MLARIDTGYNITVYLNQQHSDKQRSKGWLYMDDGVSFNYQRGNEWQVVTVEFDLASGLMECKQVNKQSGAY